MRTEGRKKRNCGIEGMKKYRMYEKEGYIIRIMSKVWKGHANEGKKGNAVY